MKVTVLYGGPSAERDVSRFRQGRRRGPARGRAQGQRDRRPPRDARRRPGSTPADVVFPVLHGTWGEDGQLQAILVEQRQAPLRRLRAAASRLGMDKAATKIAWEKAGLPTPPYELVTKANPVTAITAPCAVKAVDSGSSVDVYICKTQADADKALKPPSSPSTAAPSSSSSSRAPSSPSACSKEERPSPPSASSPRSSSSTSKPSTSETTPSTASTPACRPPTSIEKRQRLAEKANRLVGARPRPHRHHDRREDPAALHAGDQHPPRLHLQEPAPRGGGSGGHSIRTVG